MSSDNLLMWNIAAGETFTLPDGFMSASILPASGATYTITNSLSAILPEKSLVVSPALSAIYTFETKSVGWAEHVIAATGGSVFVTYSTGR